MEDRLVCTPDIPALGNTTCRFYSIFDGHEGEAAAQHVAEQLPQAVAAQLTQARRADCGCGRSGTEACNDEVAIEAALQRAVAETNAAFLRRAKEESLDDGSTAVFALLCGRRFLVGSIGDSSAVLCSRDAGDGTTAAEAAELQQAPASGGCGPTAAATASNKPTGKREQRAEVLSAVHSPAREDERRRIESAGGFVKTTADGRPRLQGELMLSRAFGDLPYREVGLTAEPEFSAWHTVSPGDQFLILASDGLLEKLSPDEVCATAAALAAGRPPPAQPAQAPAAIALGPMDGDAAVPPPQPPPPAAVGESPLGGCRPRSGIVACVDCCPGRQTGGAAPQRPASLAQAVAHALQEAAYARTALDNIVVLVIPLQRTDSGSSSSEAGNGGSALAEARAAGSSPAPAGLAPVAHRGKVVMPQGDLHAYEYELVEHLTALPQRQFRHSGGRIRKAAGRQPRPGERRRRLPATDDAEPHAVAARWLASEHDSFANFCAADGRAAAPPQLGPAETSLVSVLAGLPIAVEEAGIGLHPGWMPAGAGAIGSSELDRMGGLGSEDFGGYHLEDSFARGHFGEVWRGVRRPRSGASGAADGGQLFVLKRLMVEHGMEVRLSGLREAYFGALFTSPQQHVHTMACTLDGGDCGGNDSVAVGLTHIVRFVESFETSERDLWLVFHDEGRSLHSFMYGNSAAADDSSGGTGRPHGQQAELVSQSAWWWALRKDRQGDEVMREIVWQTLAALAAVHAGDVAHRDVKPENLLLSWGAAGPLDAGLHGQPHLRLIDFGSAVDAHSMAQLYGSDGPSADQQTRDYAPPEATFGSFWHGSRHVSGRTQALLEHRLHLTSLPPADAAAALLLRGLMELCIYPPQPPEGGDDGGDDGAGGADSNGAAGPSADGESGAESGVGGGTGRLPMSWSCTDEAILQMLAQRSPAKRGPASMLAVRLLRRLLHWNPAARPTAATALRHAYFTVAHDAQRRYECPPVAGGAGRADAQLPTGWC